MTNYTYNIQLLDSFITAIGENAFIDSVLGRLEKDKAEAIIADIATEHGLEYRGIVQMKGKEDVTAVQGGAVNV